MNAAHDAELEAVITRHELPFRFVRPRRGDAKRELECTLSGRGKTALRREDRAYSALYDGLALARTGEVDADGPLARWTADIAFMAELVHEHEVSARAWTMFVRRHAPLGDAAALTMRYVEEQLGIVARLLREIDEMRGLGRRTA